MRKQIYPIIALLVAALMLGACAPAAVEVPAPAEPVVEEPMEEVPLYGDPTLISEGLGTADDLVPSDDEIVAALAHLADEDSFIGIVACTYATEYHSSVPDAAVAYATDLGIKVETFDSELDVNKQISSIESFVAAGAKVIVVCTFDPPSVESALREAADAGVFIVEYAGRNVAEFGGVSISIEDEDLGTTAGAYAAKLINEELGGEAQVAILDFPDLPNVVVRADAIKAAIAKDAPKAVIVGNYLGGTTEFGLASIETALLEYPEINVVVSINDAGAYGAMQALEAAGKDEMTTIIVGIDAEPKALEYIEEGGMYRGTVDTAPAETGRMTINAAVKLLAGATIRQNIRVPVNLITQ